MYIPRLDTSVDIDTPYPPPLLLILFLISLFYKNHPEFNEGL